MAFNLTKQLVARIARAVAFASVAVTASTGQGMAAAGFEHASDGVYADRIDWGVMMDLTGPAAGLEVPWTNGFQDYIRKINETGGVNGRKINLLVEDDHFDASLDRIAFEKLVSQTPVLGISGMGQSSAQVALMQTIRRGGVPIVGSYVSTKAALQPASDMFYGGYCGYREMALSGVGFFNDRLKLKSPKVVIVALDSAAGKEYAGYVSEAVTKLGGQAITTFIKASAADATPQILQIVDAKADFVALHGVPNTAILLLRGLQQYGLKTPVFGVTNFGQPQVFNSLGAAAGSNFYVISCFTPAGADEAPGVVEMDTWGEKLGRAKLTEDVNYVAGWTMGRMVADLVNKVGPEPTREKLVAWMRNGFQVDTQGLTARIEYTKDDHRGPVFMKMLNYDYQTDKMHTLGNFSDFEKYLQ